MTLRPCRRILEIGEVPYFRTVFPQATVFAHTGRATDEPGLRPDHDGSISGLMRLARACKPGAFDVVVVHPTRIAPWSPDWIVRSVFNRAIFSGGASPLRGFAQLLPLLRRVTPIAVVDFDDHPFVHRHHEMLLGAATAYFKRELPVDRWRVFLGRSTGGLPSPRFRRDPNRARLLDRLHPLPLGLPLRGDSALLDAPRPKTADVFYAGQTDGNSTVRRRGIGELLALRDEGYSIDIPDRRLPRAEFMERCAAAWLVWSPEGLGWDCFRHYEAAAAWSVPLVSRPTTERHWPLEDRVHALFHGPEPGALASAVRAALADRTRLTVIAAAAHALVSAHHTPDAICRDILARMGFEPPEPSL